MRVPARNSVCTRFAFLTVVAFAIRSSTYFLHDKRAREIVVYTSHRFYGR